MRILFDMAHPAHVHFFRHAVAEMKQRGHEVLVTAQLKNVMGRLLEAYAIPFEQVQSAPLPPSLRPLRLLSRDWKLYRVCRRFQPDVVTAVGGLWAAHAAFLLRKPSVIWDDTEHHKWNHRLCWPFATAVYCPDSYTIAPAGKRRLYPGTHDLAYLHPNRFTPDPQVVRDSGIDPDSPYCIVRLSSWQAVHDIGQHGFDLRRMVYFMQRLRPHAFPYITAEGPLPAELKPYQLRIPPQNIHHVMACAKLCVGEGGSMMTEAAVLGTPAVLVSTLRAGVFERFKEYGLLAQTADTDQALAICLERLRDPDAKAKCAQARDKFLQDRIDVTSFIVETLEKHAAQPR